MKQNEEIIEFVRKTTEAITSISESTKQIRDVTYALQDAHTAHDKETINKLDNLKTLFIGVIMPLVGGILAIVGIKIFFKIP